MIECEAGRLVIKVPMTMANARGLLEAGRSVLQPGEQVFDFSQVIVKFAQIPKGVLSLAELYGVIDLLPRA
jgi:phospholipid transport system transporter-binding protein